MKLYEIEYKFHDEADEDNRYGLVVAYEVGTPSGDTLDHCLEILGDEGDKTALDTYLKKAFDIVDDDIVFYKELEEDNETFMREMEKSFSIIMKDIRELGNYE